MACAPSEDSDQPGHPPSLIRVFAVRMKKAWVLIYPFSEQQRLWSDWADAQADLSLHWAHSHFVGFVMRRLIFASAILAWNASTTTCCSLTWHWQRPVKTFTKSYIWAVLWQNQQSGTCAQGRLRSAWASAQSDQSLRCPHEESLGPYLPTERTAKTLIRLGGCPGWSEPSLGAQSFCWFCHEAAHIGTDRPEQTVQ